MDEDDLALEEIINNDESQETMSSCASQAFTESKCEAYKNHKVTSMMAY
jgi:hypothetical protein